jgi:RNA polymerase sigma-70 factor (ECF subfamily)
MTRPTVIAAIMFGEGRGAELSVQRKGPLNMNGEIQTSRASARAGSKVSVRGTARRDRRSSKKCGQAAGLPKSAELRQRKPDGASMSETLRLAQQGDAAAFEEIYRMHSRRVYSLCLRMLGDPVEAEDLAQEAFLQLFRKIHTFRGESAFSSWLHRLTANVVLMSFRRKKMAVSSLDEMTVLNNEDSVPRWEIGGPDLQLAGVFDRVNLQTVVEQLPEGYRRMFLLHDLHGYEHNEIAQILGCSIGNSKSQVHKARKRLRELLQKLKHHRSEFETMAGDCLPVSA